MVFLAECEKVLCFSFNSVHRRGAGDVWRFFANLVLDVSKDLFKCFLGPRIAFFLEFSSQSARMSYVFG